MKDLNCFDSSSQVLSKNLSKNPSINPSANSPVLRSESSSRKVIGIGFTSDSIQHEFFVKNRDVMLERRQWLRIPLAGHSIAYCGSRLVKDSADGIEFLKPAHLVYSAGKHRASLKGVFMCKDNMCPNCSRIKYVKLLNELTAVDEAAVKAGFAPVMLTLTQRHWKCTDIRKSQQVMANAWKMFSSGKNAWRKLLEKAGLLLSPTVRAVECPFTKNGWHLHYHIAFYVPAEDIQSANWPEIESMLAKKWVACVVKAGGARPSVSAQKISFGKAGGNSLGAYIAKELVDSSYKEDFAAGKYNIMTMIDIARGAVTVEEISPAEAEALVKRYYMGMKGSSKIQGVKNLCKFFGVKEFKEKESTDSLVFDDLIIYTFEGNEGNAALDRIKRLGILGSLLKYTEQLFKEGCDLDSVKERIRKVIEEEMPEGVYGVLPDANDLANEESAAQDNVKAMNEEDFRQKKEVLLPDLLVKQAAGKLSKRDSIGLELYSSDYDHYVRGLMRLKDERKALKRSKIEVNEPDYSEFL